MKTVRLSKVLEAAGEPGNHVLLVSPESDKALQQAIRTHRVMTIHQQPFGPKADYGTVGFELRSSSQYLIFPRSISEFAGLRVVGIDYGLLAPEGSTKRATRPPTAAGKKPRVAEKPDRRTVPTGKIIRFEGPGKKRRTGQPAGGERTNRRAARLFARRSLAAGARASFPAKSCRLTARALAIRALWCDRRLMTTSVMGAISFGLVTIPVSLYPRHAGRNSRSACSESPILARSTISASLRPAERRCPGRKS